jgi:hypothetical protein
MKQAIFLIVDNGIDGRSSDNIVSAFTEEKERDDTFDRSPNHNFYTKKEIVADLEVVAENAYKKLDGLEKLALLSRIS